MRKLGILAALLLLAPAVSQAKTLEELLVEKGVITKGEASTTGGAGPAKVYWNDGTRLDFADVGFTAKINTFLQTRYTFTDNDDEGGDDENTSSFDVHKAKLIVSGTARNEEFSYKLETNMVGGSDSDGADAPELDDGWIAWHPCDVGMLKMGQFKQTMSRQDLNSDSKIQFPDRTLVSDYFKLGREPGLIGTWKWMDGKVVAGAGIWNGTSDGEGQNYGGVDTKHTGIVNVQAALMGKIDSYSEGDVDWTDDPALSMGAAYGFTDGENEFGLDGDTEDTEGNRISVNANFKYVGWGLHGEYFYADLDPDVSEDSDPMGFYVQAGYFLMPKEFEIAARYGLLDCDDGKAPGSSCSGNDKVNQVSVSLNYFFWKHALKAQLGYEHINERVVDDAADDINTNKWIFQLSSYF